jgi:uncharacterized protein (DUF302 family)
MAEQGSLARDVALTYDEVLRRIPELLGSEGFGILSEVDLQKMFASQLGAGFRKYKIFGACHPLYAHRVVEDHPDAGVMLPCNVVVYEREDGGARVVAVDPLEQMAQTEHDLSDVATEVRHRLEKILAALEPVSQASTTTPPG